MITGVKKLKISENVERQDAPRILVQEVDGSVGYIDRSDIVGVGGTQYSYVAGKGTPTENATELQTAYNLAKTISGLSATNRFKIIVGTGKYEFTGQITDQFNIDTQYIDFVSLTGDADVEFPNGIYVTANDVYLKGLKTPVVRFELADNLNLLVCENCVGGDQSFGTFVTVSGTFNNCVGGDQSFGFVGTASGTFTNCIGGNNSFAANGGSGFASGTFNNCTGGDYSFGYTQTASGTFTNCVGGNDSFAGVTQQLTGKLFYCRLTSGTFQTVLSGGRTYYCVDGNGNPNNQ